MIETESQLMKKVDLHRKLIDEENSLTRKVYWQIKSIDEENQMTRKLIDRWICVFITDRHMYKQWKKLSRFCDWKPSMNDKTEPSLMSACLWAHS